MFIFHHVLTPEFTLFGNPSLYINYLIMQFAMQNTLLFQSNTLYIASCAANQRMRDETATAVVDHMELWQADLVYSIKAAHAQAVSPADRLALIRTLTWASGGFLELTPLGIQLSPEEVAELTRFGLARTFGDALRLVVSELDEIAPGLEEALRFDPRSRRVFRSATADAVLRRCSGHVAYQSATQKAAIRALLTMPGGAALMISMPTGSGKSLLFQLGPRFWRETEPQACCVVITPTIGLADDHERTLRQLPGLGPVSP
jgi:ATP-dependent DNA helicase RecQ